MITFLSDERIDEPFIIAVFYQALTTTLNAYLIEGYNNLEPMGSIEDMDKNMHNIASCVLRACKTYYNTPAEQLVQIISSISINHYLENGNKRTAVSAGLLYLTSYNAFQEVSSPTWVINNINHLKHIADAFANSNSESEVVKLKMIDYANENIFTIPHLNWSSDML